MPKPQAAGAKQTTATLTRTLRRRYSTRNSHGLPRYIGAEQVPLYLSG